MRLPPTTDGCCGQPCTFGHDQEHYGPCWGSTVCVDTDYDETYGEEYRTAVCEGHYDMWPSYKLEDYSPCPPERMIE